MILDSFLRGLHSDRKLDFKCILLTSDRRQRFNVKLVILHVRKKPNKRSPKLVLTDERSLNHNSLEA